MSEELTSSRVVGLDADLDLLFDVLKQLRELARDPDQAHDRTRVYDFSIRWGTFLHGRWERLVYYHSRAALTPSEEARYRALRTELQQALPLAQQLGLACPNVGLNDLRRRR
jgi:hypothetical protein